MFDVLIKNWWAFVIRGILAILFGFIALFLPGVTMLSLVLVFTAYAIADGVLAIVSAVRAAQQHERWGVLVLQGVFGIAAGVIAAAMPSITVAVFIALIAAWALITGSFMLAAAIRLSGFQGRWWLVLCGVASLVYGALLIIAPLAGALVLTWWIGAYAIVFGIAMVAAALRLRALFKSGPLGKMV